MTTSKFTENLAKLTDSPEQFCMELSKCTNGIVTYNTEKVIQNDSAMSNEEYASPDPSKKRKRSQSDNVGSEEEPGSKKKSKVSKESTLNSESQHEISVNHIGMW